MPDIQHKRGTRADLNTLATANGLLQGQVYVIDDEDRIAIATGVGTYQAAAKEGEGGSAANTTLDDTDLVVAVATDLQTYAEKADAALLKARSTGISKTFNTASVSVGGTTFTIPAIEGEIYTAAGYYEIDYAGATGVTVTDLTEESTWVYVDNAGVLQQQTTLPTRDDWAGKLFVMRVAVDTSSSTIISFEYLSNTLGHYANTIRDIVRVLVADGVPLKEGQLITGRAGDLGFDATEGSIVKIGATGNVFNANTVPFNQVTNAEFFLSTRTAYDAGGNTALPLVYDNNAGSLIPLGSGTFVGHRLYRFTSGNFVIQYGQGNYANLVLAKAGVLLENYVINPILKEATFFGWWFVSSTATNTGGNTLTDFVEYTIGITGGSNGALSGCALRGNNGSDFLDKAAVAVNLDLEIGVDVQAYAAVLANTTASFLTDDKTKLNYISVTQAVDLDQIEIDIAALATLGTAAQVLTVNAGATAAEWADAGGGGDFVAITEGSNTGYGTSYRADNPTNYGDIGSNAVDLSYNSSSSTTKGATGSRSTAMGNGTTASGSESTAMGNGTTASGYISTAMGDSTTASSDRSTAMGHSTTASGTWSTAMGLGTTASGSRSVAMGHYTISNGIYATVTGRLGGIGSSSGTIFAVAYAGSMPTAGTADQNLVFKVNSAGNGYFDGVADSGNADYAEYFESFDGAPLERGHFVSFVEGSSCLEYGNADIVGIVSSSPAVVGDSQSMHYKGKYKKDEFNTYIREPVVVTEELHVLSAHQQGEAWEVVTSGSLPDEMETFLVEIKNKETQEVLETLTDEAAIAGNRLYDFEVEVIGTYTHTMIDKVLSDTFDETLEYLPRSERPEWSPIGLLGKLWVYLAANEVVKVGDYITPDTGGKAVLCSRTDAKSFRVLNVNTEYSLVKVFYK
jgi:hypothetical protein